MKKASILILISTITYSFCQVAPDFTAYNYDTQQEWALSDYIGDHVIAMISGSFC